MARIATSLNTLRSQIDGRYPTRSKSSDGWIGDGSHAARPSDHNPNAAGVVQALDITHDPANGFDSYAFAETLRLNRDSRIKYVISNGRIFSSVISAWEWRPYTGANAHAQHVHVSVDDRPAKYDDSAPWKIDRAAPKPGLHEDIVATVFGGPTDSMSGTVTAYGNLVAPQWWTRPGVALPARFTERPLPQVRVTHNGKSVVCPVMDVGPWNIKDPYWVTGSRPQAESGVDMSGRRTNLAGIDLTPAAANAIGLQGKGVVDWEFIKENTVAEPEQAPTVAVDQKAMADAIQIAQVVMLVMQLMKGGQPTFAPALSAPVTQQPVVEVQPVAPVVPVTPEPSIIQRPGTQLGTILGIATIALQLFGILPPGLGEGATAAGQGLSFLAGAAPAAGATGLFSSIGSILGRLFR